MGQRFVAIPGENRFNRGQPLGSKAFIDSSSALAGNMQRGALPLAGKSLSVIDTINTELGIDAFLMEIDDEDRLDLHTTYPDLRVVPEGEARMAMARVELQPLALATMAGTTLPTRVVTIRVVDPKGKPIRGALVQLVIDEKTRPMTGMADKTNAKGEVKFPVPNAVKTAAWLRAEPAHSFWFGGAIKPALAGSKALEIVCPAIQDGFADSLTEFGGPGMASDGKGVVVAVIDGGAGPNEFLPRMTGKNLSEPSRPTADISDNGVGHGTHVAGIIAGQGGPGGIMGMAPGVDLRIYRIYRKNQETVTGFPVAAAIRQAISDGADLINLSLTLTMDDLAVVRQLQGARAAGLVCVAAAGNAGGPVMLPARHDACIGVSAMGCKGRWPKGAGHDIDARRRPKGANPKHFMASFSCFGPEIDLTGPGVGIVSLFPRGRRAVMNGTSMATPAVTGLLARLLARTPNVLNMPRNQARSDAIVHLALKSARSLGFPASYQGRGLPG